MTALALAFDTWAVLGAVGAAAAFLIVRAARFLRRPRGRRVRVPVRLGLRREGPVVRRPCAPPRPGGLLA